MARELEHPFTLVFALTSLSWIYSTLRNAKRTLELADEAIAVSTQYSFELGLAWATSSQGWALAEQGHEEGLGKLITRDFPLLGSQVQISITLLRWRCLQNYIYERNALTKAWAPLRKRRRLPSLGENCFGTRNCFD